MTAVATVEAKRKTVDVSASLQQAKRYSRDFTHSDEFGPPGGPWGKYRIPFTFATNGRPYLKQLATKSGVWFCDVRRSDQSVAIARRLDDAGRSHDALKRDEDSGPPAAQGRAVRVRVPAPALSARGDPGGREGIEDGRREMLLAMATGTGKTKTCVALIYRLLKAQRFKRVLFLVDRSALGEQAANAFKDTRMENLNTFAQVFGIKELEDTTPDTDTAVHIATIQGMVQRLLFAAEDARAAARGSI